MGKEEEERRVRGKRGRERDNETECLKSDRVTGVKSHARANTDFRGFWRVHGRGAGVEA